MERYKQVKDLKTSSPGLFITVIVLAVIFSLIMCIYPIAMIVIGAVYKNDCNIEPNIPIWLIVHGSVAIFLSILTLLSFLVSVIAEKPIFAALASFMTSIVTLFLFAWFITGSVWTFSKYSDVIYTEKTSPLYCHKTVYLFTFWTLIVSYIMIGLSFVIGICAAVIMCIVGCGCLFANRK